MTVVESLLGASWDELERSHVENFLAEAGDEGLTWEIKGDAHRGVWPRREQIEKAVSGFGNSHLGGVLILGAERKDKRKPGWALDGLEPPKGTESQIALGRAIRGVRPTPPFRIKVWATQEGREAAVIWIRPVDRPPAITRDGRVFERTTGETEPVRDPAMLSRLFAAGEGAAQQAEEKALRGARAALGVSATQLVYGEVLNWNNATPNQGRVGVGVAATAYESDIGGRLFRASFAALIDRIAKSQLVCIRAIGPESPDYYLSRQTRESIVARLDPSIGLDHANRFAIRAGWEGSVGVACLLPEGTSLDFLCDEVLRPAWTVASRLVLGLGGTGRLHLALFGSGPMQHGHAWPSVKRPVRRWLDLSGTEESEGFQIPLDDLSYVMDELRRTGGEERWNDDDRSSSS